MNKTIAQEQPAPVAACGCGCTPESGGRRALAVDPAIKAGNLKRLRRIEGQVRGLQRMVEEDRYCADILMQISAVQEALQGVGRALLRNHLRHCVSQTLRSGTAEQAETIYEELLELFGRHAG
jgi:DNA-binding FrmR family transcriptional regulator